MSGIGGGGGIRRLSEIRKRVLSATASRDSVHGGGSITPVSGGNKQKNRKIAERRGPWERTLCCHSFCHFFS